MSKSFQYFSIPFNSVQNTQLPACTMWFATWSTQPPAIEPGMAAPLVIGCTDSDLPAEAVALGTGSKDPPPPPPPPAALNLSDYQASVSAWLEATRDADE